MFNSKNRRLLAYIAFALITLISTVGPNLQPVQALTPTVPPCPVARCIDVSITDTGFSPANLTIITDRVTMVRWKNNGTMNHTVTFSSCSNCGQTPPVSGPIAPGQTFSVTFQAGLMGGGSYHCDFHTTMTGSIGLTEPTVTPRPPTVTPSPTPFVVTCPKPGIKVQPVISPTNLTTQVIHVNITTGGIPKYTVFAKDAAGNTLSTTGGPNTSSNAQDITIPLQAGTTHYLSVSVNAEVACTNGAGTPAAFNFVNDSTNVDVNGTPLVIVQQTASNDGTPYGGTARSIPGTIQAEDYNAGGEGVAYHDTTSGNSGNAYRTDNVDIQTTTDAGGGYNIGWTAAGEWTKYSVNVTSAGTYTIDFRVASTNSTGKFRLEIDGVNVTGSLAVPNTGNWQTFTTVSKTGVSLTGGQHVIKLYTEAASMNYNWIKFTNTSIVPTNTMTAPMTVSGRVTLNTASGAGVAGVVILHSYASSPLQQAAVTDSNGYYTFTKETMGHQESNTIQPQKTGYTFSPASTYFINYGAGNFTFNFVALNGTLSPTATNTACGCFTGATQTAAAGWTLTAIARSATPTATPGIAAWAPGVAYNVNDQVSYGGHIYKCIQAHTSQTGWEPPNVPALWSLVS